MEEKLSAHEQLDLDERNMHKKYQEKFYELDLHERKQETVRRGLEVLTKLFASDKTNSTKVIGLLDSKIQSFLDKLEPHE